LYGESYPCAGLADKIFSAHVEGKRLVDAGSSETTPHQTFDILIVVLYNAKQREKMRENAPKRNNGTTQQFLMKI
jgi:hypothetical protein